MKHGKKYEAALKLIDKTKVYSIEEACELVKKTSITSFDSTVQVSMKLNINTKKADQQIRGTVILPAGTGKNVRVVAITHKVDEALKAGADYAGDKELLNKIVTEKWFDFDVMCATPEMMGEIGKNGRVLGPKGLMPNPKTGTVGPDITKMVQELKAGKVEYRADKDGNVNVAVGKCSFDTEKLVENVKTLIAQILKVRPQTVKGAYVLSCHIVTTMGPSIRLDFNI
ncbi:MAG: 50S ribosomal protein L1 [bacterium]|nr:50S ribosomal protein L1 [bacterium]MDY4158720.1 50S ribosomal protein L1 [Candidatus Onthovivens sp.]